MTALMDDLTGLKSALVASAAFQSWVSDAGHESDHVYYFDCDLDNLPCVVLSLGSAWAANREIMTGTNPFLIRPQVTLEFLKSCNKTDISSTIFATLCDAVSNIMYSLYNSDYAIEAWGPEDADTPSRMRHSTLGDYITMRITVNGGIRE